MVDLANALKLSRTYLELPVSAHDLVFIISVTRCGKRSGSSKTDPVALRVVISSVSDVCVAFTDVGRIASLMREFIKNRKRQWYPKLLLQHPEGQD